jgi:predicted pyridoxine 5'-phosphate oxidase superfamily flavin-nucleotide-binding protein
MFNDKLFEVLSHPSDGIVSIVTQGVDEPHVVNSWNSYISTKEEGMLLIPVGGMMQTEENISKNNKVKVTIGNREVQGKMYKGTGFLIKGTAHFAKDGAVFTMMKEKFPWARAVLEIKVESLQQTL